MISIDKEKSDLSRGYKYGDGIFETFRVYKGNILLWSYHKMRLMQSFVFLRFQQPADFSLEKLYTEIVQAACDLESENVRVRVTFIRKAGGFYTPEDKEFEYIIESSVLSTPPFPFYETGLSVGLCNKVKLSCNDELSNLKTISALPYVLAAQHAQENDWDDAIMLNTAGRVCEGSKTNVWLVFYPDNQNFRKTQKNNRITIVTPPLVEGCVRGVMRAFLMELLKDLDFNFEEFSVEIHDLEQAKEIWFTNAIIGIQYISRLQLGEEHFKYKSILAKRMQNLLSEKVQIE